jgi:circadian clock protein KaiB
MTAEPGNSHWALTLYISGASPHSVHAIENARRLCEEELGGQVDLDIIDVQLEPALVVRDQIVAAPTLVRHIPAPLRRVVGDLSDFGRVREALGLGPPESIAEHATPGG